MGSRVVSVTDAEFERCITFAQAIVQIPSLPGQEEAVARRVEAEMKALAYDEVWIDAAGNVLGLIKGVDRSRRVLLNTHMDHVSVGENEPWPYPPFSGTIAEGRLWGRGSADLKGSLAVQLHAAALLLERGIRPACDVVMSAVVMEEVGGLGTVKVAEDQDYDLAFVGEPTANELRNGHRGRVEFRITLKGRACHASEPSLGVNPNRALGALLERLFKMPVPDDATFGPATCTPTRIITDQASTNVLPGEVAVTIDYRMLPSQSKTEIFKQLQAVAQAALAQAREQARAEGREAEVDQIEVEVIAPRREQTTWRGLNRAMDIGTPPFFLPPDREEVVACQRILSEQFARNVPVRPWRFATDGGHLAAAGIPVIGFSPAEEAVIHTARESVSLALMRDGLSGYVALLSRLDRILPK